MAPAAWKRREYKLAAAVKHSDMVISVSVPATQRFFACAKKRLPLVQWPRVLDHEEVLWCICVRAAQQLLNEVQSQGEASSMVVSIRGYY